MFLRHLLSFLALPFVMAVVVPIYIARRNGTTLDPTIGTLLPAIVLLAIGLTLFIASLAHFATRGRGTLAPWDPPKQLVVSGPYRYVRNPMISGVIFVLLGEALLLRSMPHTQWALLFIVINLIYIPLTEEPMLEARFGDAYREYCKHVGRIIPRVRPWRAEIEN